MAVGIYTDVHISNAIIFGLRRRGVTVLTAHEDGRRLMPDAKLLDRATELGYMMYSEDSDFLVIARERIKSGVPFSGVAYAVQNNSPIIKIIDSLELIAKALDPNDLDSRIEYLPY